MRLLRTGILGICGVLALAVLVTLVLNIKSATAQSPGAQTRPCCWDMWSPNWMQRDMWGPRQMGPGMRQRMARHWAFMHQGVPIAYRGARNPLSLDPKTIGEGGTLYQENCASCHGVTGMGDGKAAQSLTPSPALLAHMIRMPMAVDEYMLWSISDGGAAFGTDMPAFKDVLSKEEIWKIVAYMRAGFPAERARK